MQREIRRLQIQDGLHLEGLGLITSVLPMRMKDLQMLMYYDTAYPGLVLIKTHKDTHFISLSQVKGGTFDLEVNGNVE